MAGPSPTVSVPSPTTPRRASPQPSPSMPKSILSNEFFLFFVLIAVPCFLLDVYFKLAAAYTQVLHYYDLVGNTLTSFIQNLSDMNQSACDGVQQFFLEAARHEIGDFIYIYYFFRFCYNHWFDFLFLVLAEIMVIVITYILFDAAQAIYSSTGKQDLKKLEISVTWAAGFYAVITGVVGIPYCYKFGVPFEQYLVVSLNCVAIVEAIPIFAVAVYTVGIFGLRTCRLAKTEMGRVAVEAVLEAIRED